MATRSSLEVGGDAVLLFLFPPGPGWRRTPVVAEADAKMEVDKNCEEV